MALHCKARCAKFAVLAVVGVAALGWVTMALWNWLIPGMFDGAREIGYLQAMGLLVLSRLLFGGLRGHCGHGRWHAERCEQMTPEEREKARSGLRGLFCRGKDAQGGE